MDTLESMRAFARVVELGGFTAAARSLNISPAMVTKHIAHLEDRVGARLLNRTTRQVRPTDAGQDYLERCLALLAGIEEAESIAGAATRAPKGTLRVTAPVEFGNAHLAPLVTPFMQRYPDITLALDFTNRLVDLVQEGYDVAIRIAQTLDTGLIGRRLATSRFHVVASPAYLERHGRPPTPQAVAEHACLTFGLPTLWSEWPFARDGATTKVRIESRLISTSSEALRRAACEGAGISWLPTFVCGGDLRSGALISLFPAYDIGALGIYALYPHRQFLPVRTRAFLDFLAQQIGSDPDLDPWAP